MLDDYKIIKKKYGENFAKLCRTLFSSILDEKGVLINLLEQSFPPNRFLYDDLTAQGNGNATNKFKDYIYSLYSKERKKVKLNINETPEQLFKKAGYTLYKCETNSDVQSFKKYYAKDELLCTFKDKERIHTHTIFFAVKDNVDEIKRSDFTCPRRQDAYGTSVISIQFANNSSCYLSIKNRYNHTVDNPDATFSNDLENIYPGLTDSFEKYYGLRERVSPQQDFTLRKYVQARDGKFYKYNLCIGGTYYCPNNLIINQGQALQYDKDRFEVFEYFVLDKKAKTLEIIDIANIKDSFVDAFKNIEKIDVVKQPNGSRLIKIINKDKSEAEILVNKYNQIEEYKNNYITSVGKNFLNKATMVKKIEAKNLTKVGDCFLSTTKELTDVCLPKLKTAGSYFLYNASKLKEIDLPNLKSVKDYCLYSNIAIEKANFSKLETVGDYFMHSNKQLKQLIVPNLTKAEYYFLWDNENLEMLYAPKLESVGGCFLLSNKKIKTLLLPNLKQCGNDFMLTNKELKKCIMPKIQYIGRCFLAHNEVLEEFEAPNLTEVGTHFLDSNNALLKLYLPKLESCKNKFLYNNKIMQQCYLPKLKIARSDFMSLNTELEVFEAPNLTFVGSYFLSNNKKLKSLYFPKLKDVKECFVNADKIYAPKLKCAPDEVKMALVTDKKLYSKKKQLTNLLVKEKTNLDNSR